MNGPVRFVNVLPSSDGDADHVPDGPPLRQVDQDTLQRVYLDKLGTWWMSDQRKAVPGVTYRLDRLPDGYSVWERPRPGNPKLIDKWCYGHPTRRTFDSPNRFLPHFLNLMKTGSSVGCKCVNCLKGKAAPKPSFNHAARNSSSVKPKPPGLPSRAVSSFGLPRAMPHHLAPAAEIITSANTGVYKPKGRQWVEGRTDEEGTPDPYRNNIDKLKAAGNLDVLIEEKMSADWRAERDMGVDNYFKEILERPSWTPRAMEIVLFVRNLEPRESLFFDESTKKYMIKATEDDSIVRGAVWEAALVTQTSSLGHHHQVDEILHEAHWKDSITSSGFRVEPLSDANSKNGKGVWKRYAYVRLDQMRPFCLWRVFLSGVDNDLWHPTISNAMLVASTLTLVKRYRFKGRWPEAKIYCRAMYLGHELIVEGDFVHVSADGLPHEKTALIMKIESITLHMWNLDKASSDDYDEGHPYNSAARITGIMYTKAKELASEDKEAVVSDELTPIDLHNAGPWYRFTSKDKRSRIPFHRVIGRVYQPAAVAAWINGSIARSAPLTPSHDSTIMARKYSSNSLKRIPEGKSWYWADTRVSALDLEEVNGLLVSSQDPERDPKKYRKEIRVIDGVARPEERLELRQGQGRSSALTRTMGSSGMVASALASVEDVAEVAGGEKRAREEEYSESDEERLLAEQAAAGLALSDEGEPSSDEDVVIVDRPSTPRAKQPIVIID